MDSLDDIEAIDVDLPVCKDTRETDSLVVKGTESVNFTAVVDGVDVVVSLVLTDVVEETDTEFSLSSIEVEAIVVPFSLYGADEDTSIVVDLLGIGLLVECADKR